MSAQTEYITKGSSQFSVLVGPLLQDNSGTNPGDPLTGLVFNSAGLTCYYKSGGTGAVTQLSLATQTSTGAFSLGGLAQLSSSNMPGMYRLDVSTTLFSSGDNVGALTLAGYVDLAAHTVHLKFTDLDLYSSAVLLSTAATSPQLVDDIWNESLVAHQTALTAGRGVTLGGVPIAETTITSTPDSTSLRLTAGSTVDNFYKDQTIRLLSGAGTGQARVITSYTGATKQCNFEEGFVVTPANGNAVAIQMDHVHPVSDIADGVWDEVLTGATHDVPTSAGRRLRAIQEFQGYENGSVWIDTVNGTAGTTSYENGTVENPVDTIADATTIATAVGLKSFHVLNGSTITLAQAYTNYDFVGQEWTLALGGQNIGGSFFRNVTQGVSGTGTGTTPFFEECSIGTATLPPCAFDRCGFTSTLTIGSAGNYYLVDCFSQVAGGGSPTIDMGAAVGASFLNIRRWSGGLTINNIAAGDVISVDVVSGGTITVNGTGGSIFIRGMCDVTDGSGGSVTITQTSVVNMTKVNDEVVDVLYTDTLTLPGQAAISNTPTIAEALAWVFKKSRNKMTNDGSTTKLYADNGTTVDQTQATSVSSGVVTKDEWASGP